MASRTRTVLVVDDEVLLRLYARDVLEQAGYQVREASDGQEALEVLRANGDVDLVMTDVRMPGPIDGLALAQAMRRDHPAIRSLVVSGHAFATDSLNGNVDRFLSKPYGDEALVAAVRSVLN